MFPTTVRRRLQMPTLLIIDDERNVAYSLEKGLKQEGLAILTANSAREGLALTAQVRPDVILLDVQLPDMSGLEALEQIRASDRKAIVIVITAHGTSDTAIEAMKRGAYDYVLKPWRLATLKELVQRAIEAARLSRVPALFEGEPSQNDGVTDRIIGRSLAMQLVFKEIGRIAAQDVNVLILGESGTGKALIARAIYHHSQRSEQPFLAINCAALPEALLESELFGQEPTAFAGTERPRTGKVEQARGGTLFLDEIGELTPATQAKILRLLVEGHFERTGSTETRQADVRLLASTSKDLEAAIRRKEFRHDLFYHMNTFTLSLPPLRDREEDIALLAEHFLRRDRARLAIDIQGLAPNFMQALCAHHWTGNVRELESAIRYAMVHATGPNLTLDDLPITPFSESLALTGAPAKSTVLPALRTHAQELQDNLKLLIRTLLRDGTTNLHEVVHSSVDRILIEAVLKHCEGHQTQAAELLGISRTTLRSRMQQLEMAVEKAVQNRDSD